MMNYSIYRKSNGGILMDKKINNVRKPDTFDSEYMEGLDKLFKENADLAEFKWFLDEAYDRAYSAEHKKRDVVILGTMIPEELVIAAGVQPRWIIGGSLGSTAWSDDIVPRDTDPISRSVLGYINRPESDFSDTLFIIPLIRDSMRKIAGELRSKGMKICLVDIPPDRRDVYGAEKFKKQLKEMCAAAAAHTGSKVTRRGIVSAMKRVSAARAALRRFMEVSRGKAHIITDAARMLVGNSYYMTASLDEWTFRTEALSDEIEYRADRLKNRKRSRPEVIIAGSPVLFPNYKVPFLVQDSGLSVWGTVDPLTMKSSVIYDKNMMRGSMDRLIGNIASLWRRYDASSAYIKNDVIYDCIAYLAGKGSVEGVVYHVLKGQIEYDFELERIESMLSKFGIPVFRLETDYQYQDVEQLRIRMEAFSEMLVQNRYRRERNVS